MKIAPITSLQPPYSMLRRAIEAEILPFAQANGIGVINYSPMLSGLLAGKMTAERIAALPADDWRRKNVEFSEPRLSRNLRLVELLREHRQRARRHARRGGRGVDAAQSRHYRSHCGRPRPTAGGRNGSRAQFPAYGRRVRIHQQVPQRESRLGRTRKLAPNEEPRPWPGFCICGEEMPGYIAATKSGTMTAAFSCSSCVMRAAMPVYIAAAR